MAKYSDEFKLQVVLDYLNGSLGYKLITRKYNISGQAIVERWVRAFKAFGKEGIIKKKKKQFYTVQFKQAVLHFMRQTGASYQDTAIRFNMNNPTLIANWNRMFLSIEGLQEKVKGRPSMPKKSKVIISKNKNEISREEQLERENELLRLEVAYLKKLKAFRENPKAFLEKHKQSSPSNLKKKDFD